MEEQNLGKLTCPKCGNKNGCQSQLDRPFSCWCQKIKLTDSDRTKIEALGFSAECLCLQCIDSLSKDS